MLAYVDVLIVLFVVFGLYCCVLLFVSLLFVSLIVFVLLCFVLLLLCFCCVVGFLSLIVRCCWFGFVVFFCCFLAVP